MGEHTRAHVTDDNLAYRMRTRCGIACGGTLNKVIHQRIYGVGLAQGLEALQEDVLAVCSGPICRLRQCR